MRVTNRVTFFLGLPGILVDNVRHKKTRKALWLAGFCTSLHVSVHLNGTEGRNRTGTMSPSPDFESGASTSSATPAKSGHYRDTSIKMPVHFC